jgi:hypothetical protein
MASVTCRSDAIVKTPMLISIGNVTLMPENALLSDMSARPTPAFLASFTSCVMFEIACVLFRTPHLSSLFYCPSVNNPCVQDDPLAANPPTSKSPDRKFDADMDDTRVEKLNTVEAQYEINPVIDACHEEVRLAYPPWLFGICQLVFIDRSSIGNAKIDGLTKDLKLTGKKKIQCGMVVFTFLTKPLMFRLIGWSSTFRLGAICLFFSSTRALPLDSF